MTNLSKLGFGFLAVTVFVFSATAALAVSSGVIDPANAGSHNAAFLAPPTAEAGSERINFGKFTTAADSNIKITNGVVRGFAWSTFAGWIEMSCLDTTSGCSDANSNFQVLVDTTGVFSGYAWGQDAGWINFGPFTQTGISQVKIINGSLGGTLGAAGYAWSEKYGWIVFDCTNTATCSTTDYVPNTLQAAVFSGGASVKSDSITTPKTTSTETVKVQSIPDTQPTYMPTAVKHQTVTSIVSVQAEPKDTPITQKKFKTYTKKTHPILHPIGDGAITTQTVPVSFFTKLSRAGHFVSHLVSQPFRFMGNLFSNFFS